MNSKNTNVVLIFPGQGSQFVGMGKALYDDYIEARHCFDRVDNVLSQKLTKIIFEGDADSLTQTSNAQPAIMVSSMAAISVILKQGGYTDTSLFCSVSAGHSLGEYTALCSANALTLEDAALLLRKRGDAMEYAAGLSSSKGSMIALLGVEDIKTIYDLLAKVVQECCSTAVCQIANDNGAGQVVLSGTIDAIDFVAEHAKNFGCAKAIKLNVSGPFHSSLLQKSQPILRSAFEKINIMAPKYPVISNTNATEYKLQPLSSTGSNFTDDHRSTLGDWHALISENLVKQICMPVRWRETIDYIVSVYKPRAFVEIGPGKVLSTLCKRMYPEIQVLNAFDHHSIEELLTFLSKLEINKEF